jgi:hypothetical protein
MFAASPAIAIDPPTETEMAWLAEHAPKGFDVYPDGIWVSAGVDTENTSYGIRLKDLRASPGKGYQVTVWMRADYRQNVKRPYRTGKFRLTFDCAQDRYWRGAFVNYRADGSVHSEGSGSGVYGTQDIVPGSMAEQWAKLVCWH